MNHEKDTKTRILDAALELFYEQGYRGTTTRAIAENAGVNEVTLFRHFGSKERIFFAAVDRETDIQMIAVDMDMECGDDLEGELVEIGMFMLENMLERARLLKVLIAEVDNHPELYDHASRAPKTAISLLSRYIKAAKAKGMVGDIDPEVASVAFFSFVFRSLVMNAFMGRDFIMEIDRKKMAQFVKIFVRGIGRNG